MSDLNEYWVHITYDTGREEVINHLNLNEAYEIKCSKEREHTSSMNDWIYSRTQEHITDIATGRHRE